MAVMQPRVGFALQHDCACPARPRRDAQAPRRYEFAEPPLPDLPSGAPSRTEAAAEPEDQIMRVKDVKKVVLAYSGGLDTSVILKWLQTTYRCEVVTFTADLGQGEELGPARDKALLLGIK